MEHSDESFATGHWLRDSINREMALGEAQKEYSQILDRCMRGHFRGTGLNPNTELEAAESLLDEGCDV